MKLFNKGAKRQALILIGIMVVAALASFGAVYAVTGNKSSSSSVNEDCNGTCVSLYKDKASPNTIAVAKGGFVQFNSKDGNVHDLSLGGGGSEHEHKGKFQSGDFKGDEGWRVQFNDEGTFTFHDHYNPEVNVVVVVYTPGKQYKVE